MLLHGYHANRGCGLPGDEETTGKKCGKIAEGITGKVSLPKGLIMGKGKMVIFKMLKHIENWFQQNGLDETKKWALESPQSELRAKSYEVFSARDLSVMKIFSNRAWTEKQKAY